MSKENAEKKVIESLDTAIFDMAKENVLLVSAVEQPKKRARKQKAAVSEVVVVEKTVELPENFVEVVQPSEELIVSSETKDSKKKSKTKKAVAKKGKKIKGFFAKKSKKVSRETLRKAKLVRSKYWTNGVGEKFSGLYSQYKKNFMTGALALLMLGFVTATTYVTYAYVTANNADLVNSVGKHVILPTSETPKVYIVQSEKADLFKNPLFKGIQVGDNVLTYTREGRVIIYRSSEDKIVNIVNLQN